MSTASNKAAASADGAAAMALGQGLGAHPDADRRTAARATPGKLRRTWRRDSRRTRRRRSRRRSTGKSFAGPSTRGAGLPTGARFATIRRNVIRLWRRPRRRARHGLSKITPSGETTMTTSREIRLKSRPVGTPTAANFELATVTLPDPGPGEVQVRNTWMTVDPYMRGPDERREELRPAVPDRRGDAGRRGGRGDRLQRPGVQGRRAGAELLRLARGVQRPGRGGAEAGHPRPAAAGVPGRRRHAGPDRLCRPAEDRRPEGRATWCSSRPRPARSARSSARSPSSRATR